ncbi:MAG: haloacid dehalogenase-like hydrolase [Pseudobdellovibrionaceae bacterium]|nr:haloacid dehalogenase-like hydrolase [Bdellovibrionales bacterium]USN46668.1 MAG: haloacid dehalogenase-like hydrolase [Pseudobdellovibrionaceae bacterium]
MIEFPQSKVNEIIASIDRHLDQFSGTPVAAFDADGTLWDMDLGENFFKYQIRENLLPDLPANPWEYYLNLHDNISAVQSYLWLAQINADLPIDQVREWAKKAVATVGELPIFKAHKQIIDHLLKNNVDIFIVTASIQWAVEPGAQFLDIPTENVIGVKTRIENGLVTTEQEGAVTYREGKVTGLLERNGNRHPFFCAGNTQGDLPLLEASKGLRLVVAASPETSTNYKSERKMIELANERGWFCHSYL